MSVTSKYVLSQDRQRIRSTIDNGRFTSTSMPPNNMTMKTSSTSSKPLVLLVEDNIVALHLIETIVAQAGLRFKSVTNGEKALELAQSETFDLIITDIGLPGISGYELAQTIREWEGSKQKKPIPIIGITAHAQRDAKKECSRVGINKMLAKPINLKTVEELMKEFIQTETSPAAEAIIDILEGFDLPSAENQLYEVARFPLLDTNLGINNIGNKDFFKSMLQLMLEHELPGDEEAISQAYEARNWAAVEKIAHKMKGGAIYCGTIRLQYACQYLERYRKAGYSAGLESLYLQLQHVLAATKKAIENWLQSAEVC